MENNLPYCLFVSFENAIAFQNLEKHLAKEGFEKTKSEQTEQERYNHFLISASGDLSPRIVPAIDDQDFTATFTIFFPVGISIADLELSFRFLVQLEAFQPEIRDQEIQNQHFIKKFENLEANRQSFVPDNSFISDDTIISADFDEFKRNTLNITKRRLILQFYQQ